MACTLIAPLNFYDFSDVKPKTIYYYKADLRSIKEVLKKKPKIYDMILYDTFDYRLVNQGSYLYSKNNKLKLYVKGRTLKEDKRFSSDKRKTFIDKTGRWVKLLNLHHFQNYLIRVKLIETRKMDIICWYWGENNFGAYAILNSSKPLKMKPSANKWEALFQILPEYKSRLKVNFNINFKENFDLIDSYFKNKEYYNKSDPIRTDSE